MLDVVHYLTFISRIAFVAAMFVLCCINFIRQKTKFSFSLVFGVFLCMVGVLWQLIIPFSGAKLNSSGEIIESFGNSMIWYIGSIFYSVGLIIVFICMLIVVLKKNGIS